jgi:phosphoglycolate phosphatase
LREAGVARGVCTNEPDAIAHDLLQALGVAGAFGCILGGDTRSTNKPDPAGAARVMAALGA